jgi:hypothetical protein
MRRILLAAGAAALLAVPATADASCKGRKNTGTAIGAIAGGLLGNAVAARGVKTEGTLLGAGVGAVVGHQVAKSGCSSAPRRTAYRSRSYARTGDYRPASYAPACRWEERPYYNQYGELVYAQARVCR